MSKKRGNGDGGIYKLSNGYWEARITKGYNQDGKQMFKTFTNKSRKIVADKLNNYIANEKGKEPENACNLTFGAWLDIWCEEYVIKNVKISTRVSYEMNIRLHIKPYIGNIKLKDLKKAQIEEMYSKLSNEGRYDGKGGLSVKTVKNIRIIIHSALEEAMRREYIIKNPAHIAKVPTYRSTNKSRRKANALTKEEQIKLVTVCGDDTYGLAIKLLLYRGLRKGELLALQWSDIDFEKRKISINKQLNRLHDYSQNAKAKTRLGIQEDVKTKTSNRIISMPDNIADMLKFHKKQQEELKRKFGSAYYDLNMVFAREDGNYIDPRTLTDKFNKLCKEAGIGHHTIHELRHTFATRAIENKISIKDLSSTLGHANIQITLDTYSHILQEFHEDEMDKLDEYLDALGN